MLGWMFSRFTCKPEHDVVFKSMLPREGVFPYHLVGKQ